MFCVRDGESEIRLDNLGSERQIIAMFLLQMIFKIRPLINENVGSRWHL